MTKWARKDLDNHIVEIIDFDPNGKFHESIIWHEVDDSATVWVAPFTPEESPAPTGPALTPEEQAKWEADKAEATAKANAWRAAQGIPPVE
jgi:hypothetical protein